LLGDASLLNTLLDYDKEDMDLNTMNLIRENYTNQTLFDPDMLSTISVAATGLCMWYGKKHIPVTAVSYS